MRIYSERRARRHNKSPLPAIYSESTRAQRVERALAAPSTSRCARLRGALMGARALAVTTAPPPLHHRSTAASALTCVLLHVGTGRTST